MSLPTIATGLAQRKDHFLLLRFLAAAMVIYGHAPAIAGGPSHQDLFAYLNWGDYSGAIAVQLFFIVSGFLVTGSYLRRDRLADFLWARAIRILPAYALCLGGCAIVLGALFTRQALPAYFAAHDTWDYVLHNLLFPFDMRWNLPDVFVDNPHRSTVNGSLWTLPGEVRLYLGVAAFGLLGALSRPWRFALALALLVGVALLWPAQFPLLPLHIYGKLAALFALGGACYVLRERIPVHGALLLALAALAWALRATPLYACAFALAQAQFVFWFAYRLPGRGRIPEADYSYGLYLWGFPVQQSLAALAPHWSAYANAALAFVVALLLAMLSWHAVERPALALKDLPERWRRRRAAAADWQEAAAPAES